jgi:NAD-dependent dihydropyrimidine dehydrogenase PreA subunit
MGNNQKWLPAIDQDLCTGCSACLDVCEPKCLEMEDGLVVLRNPDACLSDEHCIDACAVGSLEMKWAAITGDAGVGKWQEAAA